MQKRKCRKEKEKDSEEKEKDSEEYIRDLLYYRYQECSPLKTSSHGRLHVYMYV